MGGNGEEEDIVYADKEVEMTVDVGKEKVTKLKKHALTEESPTFGSDGVRSREGRIRSRRRERCLNEKMNCMLDY